MSGSQLLANFLLAILAVVLLLLSVKRVFCSSDYTIHSALARKWMQILGFAAAVVPLFNLILTAVIG